MASSSNAIQPKITDLDDTDLAAMCDETFKGCCTNFCAKCEKCLGQFARFAEWIFTQGTDLVSTGALKPAFNAVAKFFQSETGQYRVSQPVRDALMGGVVNPAELLFLDHFPGMSTNKKTGKPIRTPFANLGARIGEFALLFYSALPCTASSNKLVKGVSATLILTGAAYFAIQTSGLVGTLMGLRTISQVPWQTLGSLISTSHSQTATQKALMSLAGIWMGQNGAILGKEFLNNVQQAYQEFWNHLLLDFKKRHLKALDKMKPEERRKAEDDFYQAIQKGTAYTKLDFLGRSFETILKIPANLFQALSHVTKNITSFKVQNQLAHKVQDQIAQKFKVEQNSPGCLTRIGKWAGLKTKPVAPVAIVSPNAEMPIEIKVEMPVEVKKGADKERPAGIDVVPAPLPSAPLLENQLANQMDYEDVLAAKEQDFYKISALGASIWNAHVADSDKGKKIKVTNACIANMFNDMELFLSNKPLTPPVLPEEWMKQPIERRYGDKSWEQVAREDIHIINMLNANFNPSLSLAEKAKLYQACKYAFYAGMPEKVATLVADSSKPPAYEEPDFPSHIDLEAGDAKDIDSPRVKG